MKTTALLFIAGMFFIPVCHAQDFDYSFKESYTVTVPARLSVSSHDGNIEVIPGDGNTIEVYYIARKLNKVLKIDRQGLEKELTVETSNDGSSVRISVRNEDQNFNFNFKDQVHVSFRIRVPKEIACDLRTSDGNIALSGLISDQQLKTSDGNIKVSSVQGGVIAKTSDGNIHLSRIGGSVEVNTSDGDIALEDIKGNAEAGTSDGNIGLSRISGDIAVRTSDGNIDFHEISGSLKAVTSDGNVSGRMVTLKKQLIVSTGDGNISLTIPDKLGLDLDIRGEAIDVPLNNFTGKSDKKVIKGQSNGGGIAVSLSSSDGNVRVVYL